MKKTVIRKGSTVAYKCYVNGRKEAGIGIVREIDRESGLCVVSDYGRFFTCLISDCENTCNW